jgi:hypothetical protein
VAIRDSVEIAAHLVCHRAAQATAFVHGLSHLQEGIVVSDERPVATARCG